MGFYGLVLTGCAFNDPIAAVRECLADGPNSILNYASLGFDFVVPEERRRVA